MAAKHILAAGALSMIASLTQAFTLDKQWREHLNESGMILASRPFTGHGQPEFFATLPLEGPPHAMLSLLLDINRVSEWAYHADGSTVITHPTPDAWRVHSRFSPPWPIRDRDVFSHSVHWQNVQGIWLEIKSIPDEFPPQPGYVRIRDMQNCWHARANIDGTATLYHLGHVRDPGLLPNFVINPAQASALKTTLKNMAKVLPSYRQKVTEIGLSQPPHNWHYCQRLARILDLNEHTKRDQPE
ncbi:hypothetical protein [Echinimonas agarilytica]|uniref:START domain-containing protein n=1 Tax=Echinimonas agarilytica TaxID=1215918 RepID=A0AA41W4G3_9GAMM|nr:hypothetical protein [Echinimonas agarilytica]MCM2678298.1 hypothetical protein [Echinimonas agarilytica]